MHILVPQSDMRFCGKWEKRLNILNTELRFYSHVCLWRCTFSCVADAISDDECVKTSY